jgi:hypothetical protein
MPEPIFMKLGMYIMATDCASAAYFITHSDQSLCLYTRMYPHIVATQRLSKNFTAAKNTHATVEELFRRVVFYALRVASKESRRLVFRRTSCYVFMFYAILKDQMRLLSR